MNAAERFFAASQARDFDAAVAELATDVVLLTPRNDQPVVGRDAAAAVLRAVEANCDEFRHTHLLVSGPDGDLPLIALVFEAKVGEEALRGVDLIELDENDQISTFSVAARPMSAVMALGKRMGPLGAA